MPDQTGQPDSEITSSPSIYAEPVAAILEANGLGDRAKLVPSSILECAADASGNRLLIAEVGIRKFFVTLSPALKGRLVGEDRIEDDEVRQHFEVNVLGASLKK